MLWPDELVSGFCRWVFEVFRFLGQRASGSSVTEFAEFRPARTLYTQRSSTIEFQGLRWPRVRF